MNIFLGVESDEEIKNKSTEDLDAGWSVIVWNDPVNLMSYVVHVFMKVLGMNHTIAQRHMLEVHHKGKSLVAHETREKAEFLAHQLQSYGLQATIEPVE